MRNPTCLRSWRGPARSSSFRVELAAADSGEGVPPELLERVFERFFRVDPARSRNGGGSGIGLTITRAIVEAHGGRVWAESAGQSRGTRVVLRLPTLPPTPGASGRPGQRHGEQASQ